MKSNFFERLSNFSKMWERMKEEECFIQWITALNWFPSSESLCAEQSWPNVRPATFDIWQLHFGVGYTFSTLLPTLLSIVGLKYWFDSRPLKRVVCWVGYPFLSIEDKFYIKYRFDSRSLKRVVYWVGNPSLHWNRFPTFGVAAKKFPRSRVRNFLGSRFRESFVEGYF